jgi:orotate phosphoribosyltransferase
MEKSSMLETASRELLSGLARTVVEVDRVYPVTFRSGIVSPVYINCRKIQGEPNLLSRVVYALSQQGGGVEDAFDAIAGVQNAAIPYSVSLALRAILPHVSIRKREKEHGVQGRIEGGFNVHGKRVLLIEDVVTEGESVLDAIRILKEAGATVVVAAITSYGLPGVHERIRGEGEGFSTLVSFDDLLTEAVHLGVVSKSNHHCIKEWLADPGKWTRQYKEKHFST